MHIFREVITTFMIVFMVTSCQHRNENITNRKTDVERNISDYPSNITNDLNSALKYKEDVLDFLLMDYDEGHLPDEFFSLLNLSHLTIKNCKNIEFPTLFKSLSKCTRLKTLEIINSNLNVLPDEIILIDSLQSLICHDDKLVSISDKIDSLKMLKELTLCCNIPTLPDAFSNLNLTLLNLSNNNIEAIPTQIFKLKNLEILNLQNTNIDSLPAQLGSIKKLKSIRLAGTPLAEYEIICSEKSKDYCKLKEFKKVNPDCVVYLRNAF